MKNIKKLSATLLATAMIIGGLGTGVSADESEKSISLTYTKAETFNWSVPSTISLTDENTTAKKLGEISVSNVHIAPKREVAVTCTTDATDYSLVNTVDSSRTYKFKIGSSTNFNEDDFDADVDVLIVPAEYTSSTVMTTPVYIQLNNQTYQYAGTYNATVTFTAEVRDAS